MKTLILTCIFGSRNLNKNHVYRLRGCTVHVECCLFQFLFVFSSLIYLYCTVLYCIVLYFTVLYCTLLYCSISYWLAIYLEILTIFQMLQCFQCFQCLQCLQLTLLASAPSYNY